jgi:DNA-binding transcriptional ArsR family regulator
MSFHVFTLAFFSGRVKLEQRCSLTAAQRAAPRRRPAEAAFVPKPTQTRSRKRAAASRLVEEPAARWTFLTNHAHVLALLHANPEMILRDVAAAVGITERAVQHIVHNLVEDGFIEREKVGRQNRYRVITDQPLRHPIEAHRTIGDLLKLIRK